MAAYSKRTIGSKLAAVDFAASADARGAALEDLSRYLFEMFNGVECSGTNLFNAPRSHELDLAFWNDQRRSLLFFLDAVLVLECKATAHPVGSAEVGWFVRKLQDLGVNHGILVALNGITGGGDGRSSAHDEVITAFVRDKIKILLLTRVEIEGLTSSRNLANLLKRKLLILTLKRAVDSGS
jgi:hypothetical protein